MRFKTEVEDITTEKNSDGYRVTGVVLKSGETLTADKVVIAPGRDGSVWLANVLRKRRLRMMNNQVDIGVRVETSNIVMEEINEHL